MKNISLILVSFFISYLSYSQVIFGVKSGINIATTRGMIEYTRLKLGWYGGTFATIPLDKKSFYNRKFFILQKVLA